MRSNHSGHAEHTPGHTSGHTSSAGHREPLVEWVDAGLISPEQADRIRAHEQARPGRRHGLAVGEATTGPSGTSLVVEALGYLGGIIMLTGAGILVGLYWQDVPVAGRLLLTGGAALALAGGGFAVPDRFGEAAGRLRSLLWALAVAATGAFMTVLSTDVLDRHDEDALIVVYPTTALVALVLWSMRRTWLQQLALLVPVGLSAIAVGLQVSDADAVTGLAIWLAAAVWIALAWTGRLEPRATGLAFGGVAAVFGTMTMPGESGIMLGLATAVVLVALALADRSLSLLAVSALGLLESAPRAVMEWLPGRLSASLTLIVVGGLLVVAAVWVARHQHERRTGPEVSSAGRGATPPG